MNILYQFDEKYVPFAGVSMLSLFENNKNADSICVFVLETGISEDSRKRLQALAGQYNREIVFLPSGDIEKECISLQLPTYRGSMAANMRLFATKVIPSDIDRLLYLDSDTIVNGSLSELFSLDMNGHPIGMVQDSLVRGHKKHIGFDKDEPYYNSGMILYDLKTYFAPDKNGCDCNMRMIDHIKNKQSAYPNPDQDLLNVVFRDDIYTISPRFNFQPVHRTFSINNYFRVYGQHGYYSKGEIQSAIDDTRIYHFFRFVGQFPWHKETIHPDRDLFNKYLSMSPWKDLKRWDNDSSVIFKLERLMYRFFPKLLFLFMFHASHEIFTAKENRQVKKTGCAG